MKRLFASAVLLSVVFSADLPFVSTTTAFAAGGPSSSYRYLKGSGKVVYGNFEDSAHGVVLHDFNKDGYTDVGYSTGGHVLPGTGKTSSGRTEIFLNDRKGRLNLKTKQAFTGRPPSWKNGFGLTVTVPWNQKTNGKSTLIDLTGDGRADWLVPNTWNNLKVGRLPIIQTTATGKLKVGPAKGPLATFHAGSLGDIDRDGDYDFIWSISRTHISHNPGNGKFVCKGYLGPPWVPRRQCFTPIWKGFKDLCPKDSAMECYYSFANIVIDLNKDGFPEIITSAYNANRIDGKDLNSHLSGRVYVFKNINGKSFRKTQTLAGPGKWRNTSGKMISVAAADSIVGDIDGDGDLDGIFYYECGDFCSGTNPLVVLKNLGNGKVKRWQIINASPARGGYDEWKWNKALKTLQFVDLNGDKRPDFVVNYTANYNGSMKDAHKQIWMNKGNGKFKRLTTPIFAKVSGNSRKAKIVALHANKDKMIDWLVIWSDGTYGTLIAR